MVKCYQEPHKKEEVYSIYRALYNYKKDYLEALLNDKAFVILITYYL